MDDYQDIMTRKLGLGKYNKKLIGELLKNMAVDKVDYTNFFRSLSNIKAGPAIPEDQLLIPLKDVLLDIGIERKEAWTSWVKSYIREVCNDEFPYQIIQCSCRNPKGWLYESSLFMSGPFKFISVQYYSVTFSTSCSSLQLVYQMRRGKFQ